MSKKLLIIAIASVCALCLVLVGCGRDSTSSSEGSSPASSETESSEASSSVEKGNSNGEASTDAASAEEAHDSYFVGTWDLYETEDATHEQVAQIMEQYANDEEFRAQMNEAYGRDNVEFCARFNADGTGEIDTGAELVSFTWEAKNEGAITFTSFDGKETALHLPVTDDMFTLNGDTYAKAG